MDRRAISEYVRPCPSCATGAGLAASGPLGTHQRPIVFHCDTCGYDWQESPSRFTTSSLECLERSARALRDTHDAIERGRRPDNTPHHAKRKGRRHLG